MLKLLLDEHLSPRVAEGLRRRHRLLAVHLILEWENGEFLGQNDSACLERAAAEGLPWLPTTAEQFRRKPGQKKGGSRVA
jgi:hypothetical protein